MIQVKIEPKEYAADFGVRELCCFCWQPTNWWAQNGWIACCRTCADRHDEEELPTREEWWVGSKRRSRVGEVSGGEG